MTFDTLNYHRWIIEGWQQLVTSPANFNSLQELSLVNSDVSPKVIDNSVYLSIIFLFMIFKGRRQNLLASAPIVSSILVAVSSNEF